MEDCLHNELKDGICADCGIILNEDNINSVEIKKPIKFRKKNGITKWKFIKKDNNITISETIEVVLNSLNKAEYKSQILQTILTKEFKLKLSILDKVLCTVFYILRNDNVPILVADLAPFSLKGEKWILKMVFNEFPMFCISKEYINALFIRFLSFFRTKGLILAKENFVFAKILEAWELKITTNILYLIICMIFMEHVDLRVCFVHYGLKDFIKPQAFKELRRKLCRLFFQQDIAFEEHYEPYKEDRPKKYNLYDIILDKMALKKFDEKEIEKKAKIVSHFIPKR